MSIGAFFLAVVSLMGMARTKAQTEPVLFIGQPCCCMASVNADNPQESQELLELLSEREYRWVVVFEPVPNVQHLAGYLIKTQPQAQIVLTENYNLAAKYRLRFAPSCCKLLEMLEKDREQGWKSGF